MPLGSLRCDSGWQGGSGRMKRRRTRRTGAGEAKRDMAAGGSHEKREVTVRQEDGGIRLRRREVGGGRWVELRVV